MSRPLPPRQRGSMGRRLTAAAARGVLELPVCEACGRVQYPPREVCGHCLADALVWRAVTPTAKLLAATRLHHSNEPYFAERLPRRQGLVALDEGAQAVVHLGGNAAPGDEISLHAMLDRSGEGVLVGRSEKTDAQEAAIMEEFTFNPKDRRFVVYAASGKLADALVDRLLDAGAAFVYRFDDTESSRVEGDRVEHLALGKHPDRESIRAAIGQVDGLIVSGLGAGRAHGLAALSGEMGAHALTAAVHRPRALIEALREPLAASGGVILHAGSVFARCHLPAMALESAVQAMALSVIEHERARCHAQGVRVLSLFAGPYEGPPTLPLPAASPARIARSAVAALADGLEESTTDPVAEDLDGRLRETPKVVERELATLTDN